MQNDKRLLSCPFCGGEAKIDEIWEIDNRWLVRCQRCFCRTTTFGAKKSAVITWNTRKPMGDVASKVQQVIWDSCSGDEYKYASKEIERIFDEVYVEGGVDNAN